MDCPRTVLVIEDEPDTREALSELLEDAGFDVVAVGDGQAGLDHLALAAAATCLIVLDLMMPGGLNGWQFRAAQLQRPDWASIPVIVVSAVADLSPDVAGLKAVSCFPKPAPVEELLGVVERHCARSR